MIAVLEKLSIDLSLCKIVNATDSDLWGLLMGNLLRNQEFIEKSGLSDFIIFLTSKLQENKKSEPDFPLLSA